MNPSGPIFIPIQMGYCKVYLHTVGLTPEFTYLISMDDAGVGFDSPVMVYRGPVAWFTTESPIGIAQLVGLRVFFPTEAVFESPAAHIAGLVMHYKISLYYGIQSFLKL